MPKERRSRSVSFDRPSPFPSRSTNHLRHSPLPSSSRNPPGSPRPAAADFQQWDEIRCPVCMEHPHNAVLLLCASHEKGCRPFMCDTSYRHSNCLDQYRKAIKASLPADSKPNLSCPLCRGVVSGSKVVEAARKHMNSKERSCSTETCGFSGAYSELRKHARTEHPLERPSEADPERERDWRRLEQQRDLGDLFSTMQSTLGGEEDGFAVLSDGGDFGGLLPFPTITFFLVLRFRGTGGLSSSVGWSNGRRGSSRSSRSWRRRVGRVLWGESIVDAELDGRDRSDGDDGDDVDDDYDYGLDEHGAIDGNDDNGGGEEAPSGSRRRQRQTRRHLRMDDRTDGDNV
ncbi:uncharacterized protein LOC110034959 [Phalaenopsis equestris]|uniref:uncharacterized protein LOC110033673 n=1 Tax=Phalaenopsis equestris TaxID=78828 RepID=UPI0009E40AC7|nr:uncharacterized protein LOC110033673 [Phalaenopsis equestris]XP_020594856.1 uncharacterized protein LOC110034959 [Phalaenopsis equestris]